MAHSTGGQGADSNGSTGAAPHVRYELHRCPECGLYTRLIQRPTGEVYLACVDRIECGYQEALQ